MSWYKHPIFNKRAISRIIGIRPETFDQKINKRQGNRITSKDAEKLDELRLQLIEDLKNGL